MAMPLPRLEDFEPDFASAEEWAAMYRAAGLCVVPAFMPRKNTQWKRPALDSWREYETQPADDATHARWFTGASHGNMGFLTGTTSGNVGIVDLDLYKEVVGDKARAWWAGIVQTCFNGLDPETPIQTTGGGGVQILFRAPPGVKIPTGRTNIGVDIRGEGGFAMLPPSMHESRKKYDWQEGLSPWEISIVDVDGFFLQQLEKLLQEHGGRDPNAMAASATPSPDHDRNALGLIVDGREDYMTRQVWATVLNLWRAAEGRAGYWSEASLAEERASAFNTYLQGVDSRAPGSGDEKAARLESEGRGWSLYCQKWADALDQWGQKVAEEAAKPNPKPSDDEDLDDWEKTVTYTNESSPIVSLGSQSVPKNVDNVVVEIGQFNIVDPWEDRFIPVFPLECLPPVMAEFARATARSIGVDVSAAAMAALTCAAGAVDQGMRLKMKRTGDWTVPPRLWTLLVGDPSSKKTPVINAAANPLREMQKKAFSAHKNAVAQWKENGKEGDEPQMGPRYIINETTVDKLGEVLTRQDRGVLMIHDEMSMWISSIDAVNGRGAVKDAGFWAKAYDGGSYNIDRIIRGETFISNFCVSILGGVQPKVLKGAMTGALTNNGLLQRFLPVIMQPGVQSQDIEDLACSDRWDALLRRLASLRPAQMSAEPGALDIFYSFEAYALELQKNPSAMDAFQNFAGKLQGLIGSIALVLHLCDGDDRTPVTARCAERALRIVRDFAIDHAVLFYDSALDGGQWEEIQGLASYILTSDKDRYTPADFTRGYRNFRGASPQEMAKRLSPLVGMGWIVEEYSPNGGGLKAWRTVDGLREVMSKRREEQVLVRAQARFFMNRHRKLKGEE